MFHSDYRVALDEARGLGRASFPRSRDFLPGELQMNRAVLFSTVAGSLFLLDYWLFATGNPNLLGFFLPLVGLLIVIVACVYASFRPGGNKRSTIYVVLLLAAIAAGLSSLIPAGQAFAEQRLFDKLVESLGNPKPQGIDSETLKELIRIRKGRYQLSRKGFIPSERRIDYLLKMESGELFDVVLQGEGFNSSKLWIRSSS